MNYNILRFLRTIQNQNFEQIEIILIDDFSEDNTIIIIENLQKEDGRIRIIKNRKNKGTLPYIILFFINIIFSFLKPKIKRFFLLKKKY